MLIVVSFLYLWSVLHFPMFGTIIENDSFLSVKKPLAPKIECILPDSIFGYIISRVCLLLVLDCTLFAGTCTIILLFYNMQPGCAPRVCLYTQVQCFVI